MSLEIIIIENFLCSNGIIKLRNIGNAYNIIDTIESEIVIDINIKDRRRILQLFKSILFPELDICIILKLMKYDSYKLKLIIINLYSDLMIKLSFAFVL